MRLCALCLLFCLPAVADMDEYFCAPFIMEHELARESTRVEIHPRADGGFEIVARVPQGFIYPDRLITLAEYLPSMLGYGFDVYSYADSPQLPDWSPTPPLTRAQIQADNRRRVAGQSH